MPNQTEDYGYGMVEEDISGGRFLQLRKKGDEVKIRLVSKPVRTYRYWETGADGKSRPVSFPTKEAIEEALKDFSKEDRPRVDVQYAWIVIDRADGGVKVFTGAKQIAISVLGFAKDDEWGDPTTYDLRITRTEEKPNYYKTLPLPNGKGPITEDERKAVEEAAIDLAAEVEGSATSKSHNEQYGGAVDLETLPADESVTKVEETAEKAVDVEADDDSDLPF